MNKKEIEAWMAEHEYIDDLYQRPVIRTAYLLELLASNALVPRVPTKEMENKLLSRFSVRFPEECNKCNGMMGSGCNMCASSGTVMRSINVPLVTIKDIYKAIVAEAENDTSSGVIVQEGEK